MFVMSQRFNRAAPRTGSAGPRTAPLTIFYAGTVNVCEDVSEDKVNLFILLVLIHTVVEQLNFLPEGFSSCLNYGWFAARIFTIFFFGLYRHALLCCLLRKQGLRLIRKHLYEVHRAQHRQQVLHLKSLLKEVLDHKKTPSFPNLLTQFWSVGQRLFPLLCRNQQLIPKVSPLFKSPLRVQVLQRLRVLNHLRCLSRLPSQRAPLGNKGNKGRLNVSTILLPFPYLYSALQFNFSFLCLCLSCAG